MPTLLLQTTVASQALRGEDVIVTLSDSDTVYLSSIEVGQQCRIQGVDIFGTVSHVDYYGNTFKIRPLQPDFSFESPTLPGYLSVSDYIIIYQDDSVILNLETFTG
jgi:hypothetical protein